MHSRVASTYTHSEGMLPLLTKQSHAHKIVFPNSAFSTNISVGIMFGGITLMRAAAENHERIILVCDPPIT